MSSKIENIPNSLHNRMHCLHTMSFSLEMLKVAASVIKTLEQMCYGVATNFNVAFINSHHVCIFVAV